MLKLSIVIPIYNVEKFLDKCLKSVIINEEFVEYILINDGSTDLSYEICQNYKMKNVKIINNTNHGVSYSRNCGISKAVGKYIMFVDADDMLSDGWFNIVKKYFDKEFDVVYFSKDIPKDISKDNMYKSIVGLENNYHMSSPCSKLYKRSLLRNNNIFFEEDLINGEDLIFNLEIINVSSVYAYCNESIYKYRIVEGSSTKKFNSKIVESDLLFHKKLSKILPSDLECRECLINYSIQNANFIIMRQLSYLEKYKYVKEYITLFGGNPYSSIRYKKIIVKNKKIRLVLFLLKHKMFYMAYVIFRVNRAKNKNSVNYFIEL